MKKQLNRKMFEWMRSRNRNVASDGNREAKQSHSADGQHLRDELNENLQDIRNLLGESFDLKSVTFTIAPFHYDGAFVYIEELCDANAISDELRAIHETTERAHSITRMTPSFLKEQVLVTSESSLTNILEDCLAAILMGNSILLSNQYEDAIILNTRKIPHREVSEPVTETLVRGPRDGFIEALVTNLALIRKRLKDPSLTIDYYQVGRRSKTDVVVLSIKNLTNPTIVREVKRRIEKVDIDSLQETGILEQLIEENSLSPFPQIQVTERPDKVAGSLAEGRVAILVDGTPFSLIVPLTFNSFYQSPEDYYERWMYSSLIRILRVGAAFIALYLPSIYVALISYHWGLIPTDLVITLAGSREGVPFPSIVEALIMEVTIEILREAGIRLPKPIGQAVGIVGGLVIGEAAVSAGLVSPMMVIVVALTAISSFALPQYTVGETLRILRFPLMLAAAALGLFGIVISFILITTHLVRLRSFGVNYLEPLVPYDLNGWKDTIVRTQTKRMDQRPTMLHPIDKRRMK